MNKTRQVKHIFLVLCVSMVCTFFCVKLLGDTLGDHIEKILVKQDSTFTPKRDDIVIVRVDEKSLDTLQKQDLRIFSLQKSIFADLIEKLEGDNAKAIGFDIIFANESSKADKDKLKAALEKYSNIVIGAKIGTPPQYLQQSLPLPDFRGATWGAIDLPINIEVISRYRPVTTFSGVTYDALSIALYKKWRSLSIESSISPSAYTLTPFEIIPLQDGSTEIPFFRKSEGYPHISLSDVLEKKYEPGYFSGKIVLVGEYGTLIHDAYFSSVDNDRRTPGVEFHANIIESLIAHTSLHTLSRYEAILLLLIVSAILAPLFFLTSVSVSSLILIFFFLTLIFGSRYVLLVHTLSLEIFPLLTLGLFLFITTYVYRYLIMNRHGRYLRDAFSHYVSPDLVAEITQKPEKIKVGGEKRNLTIFFSDIAGFTTLSEQMSPELLSEFMNDYLGKMTDILTSEKGTLDKYIGDAVMGFFGAPIHIHEREHHACETALRQQEAVDEINRAWQTKGVGPITVRIGIASGEVIVGNFGSHERFNYTVLGDSVNLSSRLEGINKAYGTLICLSDSVYEKVKHHYICRELDTVKVKGKKLGVKIYELIARKNDTPPLDISVYEEYEKALTLYYKKEYEKAYTHLEKLSPKDPPSHMLRQRLKKILSGEITVEDGVYEMKEK